MGSETHTHTHDCKEKHKKWITGEILMIKQWKTNIQKHPPQLSALYEGTDWITIMKCGKDISMENAEQNILHKFTHLCTLKSKN